MELSLVTVVRLGFCFSRKAAVSPASTGTAGSRPKRLLRQPGGLESLPVIEEGLLADQLSFRQRVEERPIGIDSSAAAKPRAFDPTDEQNTFAEVQHFCGQESHLAPFRSPFPLVVEACFAAAPDGVEPHLDQRARGDDLDVRVVDQEARFEVSAIDRSEAGLGGGKDASPPQTSPWGRPPSHSRHGY